MKRILITAGGTGGHLFPAQALAQQCQKQHPPSEILFVAGGLNKNRCFDQARFRYQEIACSPLLSRYPWKSVVGGLHLFKGFWQAISILKKYQPDVVVGFGSYYTIPVLLASKWLKIPIVLHEANSIPGRANQWLSPLAHCVGLHFPTAAHFLKGNTLQVDLPLREGYALGIISKKEARNYYGLSLDRKTLLICGGSQGAQSINQFMKGCLPVFKKLSLQLIHLTGNPESAESLKALYLANGVSAIVKPFESQMEMAWSASDAFVGRAGASTIAESMEFEIPGVLIPYPHSAKQHQESNADFLVDSVKAGWKLLEKGLTSETLSMKIETLFNEQQFVAFKESLKTYKNRPQQVTLSQLVLRSWT